MLEGTVFEWMKVISLFLVQPNYGLGALLQEDRGMQIFISQIRVHSNWMFIFYIATVEIQLSARFSDGDNKEG